MDLGSNRSGLLAALLVVGALSGCANNDFDAGGAWFSKPLDLFGSRGGYTYSQLGETKQDRPITANDLVVDVNGACPTPAPPAQTQAPSNPGAGAPAAADAASLLGAGVAVGMSECDIVRRVGQPSAVNLGQNSNGDRTAVLTFNSGPRPGIYRFIGGRLTEMDRVAEPAALPEPEKKKSAKTKKPPKTDGDT